MTKKTAPIDDAHLLALVPELVGFTPQRSLVLVLFAGRSSCGAYRVDLPDPDHAEQYKHYLTTLVGMMCRVRGADGVLPVAYTDDAYDECGGIPRERLVTDLIDRVRTAGFRVADAFCVAADGWGSYFQPQRPRDLVELEHARTARAEPHRSAGTADEQATLPRADPVTVERTAVALDALTGADLIGNDSVELAERLLTPGEAEKPSTAALLAVVAESAMDRDVLLYTWAWGAETGRRAGALNLRLIGAPITRDTLDGLAAADRELALALSGLGRMPRPDRDRVATAIDAVKLVAPVVPEALRCPLVTILAWLEWSIGRASIAGRFLEAAARLDPAYPFAALLRDLVDGGAIPEWAFHDDGAPVPGARERAAWVSGR